MTTLNSTLTSMADIAKSLNPDSTEAQVIELLAKQNEFVQDMVVKECNDKTTHIVTARNALPAISWVRMNEGVRPSKSRKTQWRETCGRMMTKCTIDEEELRLNGGDAYRLQENVAHVQALENEAETGVFYHSTSTAPEKFQGLAARYGSTTGTWGGQIVLCDPGASGNDQTSIWFVGWGPRTIHGLYPAGTVAGIQHVDRGPQKQLDANSGEYYAVEDEWTWRLGLAVEDARYASRVANIDTGSLLATDDTLIPAMIRAYAKVKDWKTVRGAIYCNRTVWTYLWLQGRNATKNATLNIGTVEGRPVMDFMGLPIRMTDSILNTEATVS